MENKTFKIKGFVIILHVAHSIDGLSGLICMICQEIFVVCFVDLVDDTTNNLDQGEVWRSLAISF